MKNFKITLIERILGKLMFLICILISNGLAFGQIKESSIQELRSACEKDLPRSLLADANEAAKLQAKDQISKICICIFSSETLRKDASDQYLKELTQVISFGMGPGKSGKDVEHLTKNPAVVSFAGMYPASIGSEPVKSCIDKK